jgi:hypothetical protein
MGAQLVVEAVMGALAQEVEIEIGQAGREAIGILDVDGVPGGIGDAELVDE